MAIPRVDEALLERGLAGSIDEARLMVMEGRVYIGGGKAMKPSDKVKPGLTVSVRGAGQTYVSRGAYKLLRALESFQIDLKDRIALDVGASTGGFTDVMLRAGASRVYAVDVGFGLLDWKLRADARVSVMEKHNARALTPDMFDPRPSFGATDVSFISLKAVLPPALNALAGEDRAFVALIKPQFEARREQVGAGGVVRDRAVHEQVIGEIVRYVSLIGWTARGLDFSPITGAEGNIEFLLHVTPSGTALGENEIAQTVARAWATHGTGL